MPAWAAAWGAWATSDRPHARTNGKGRLRAPFFLCPQPIGTWLFRRRFGVQPFGRGRPQGRPDGGPNSPHSRQMPGTSARAARPRQRNGNAFRPHLGHARRHPAQIVPIPALGASRLTMPHARSRSRVHRCPAPGPCRFTPPLPSQASCPRWVATRPRRSERLLEPNTDMRPRPERLGRKDLGLAKALALPEGPRLGIGLENSEQKPRRAPHSSSLLDMTKEERTHALSPRVPGQHQKA